MPASDGSNSSASPGDPSRSDRDAKIEEAKIFNSFTALIRSRFSEQANVDRLDKLYQHPEYAAEKAMLTRMNNNGMTAAIVTGIGSFLFLRRGPRIISRYMLRRAQQRGGAGGAAPGGGGGGYRFDATGPRSNPFESANALKSAAEAGRGVGGGIGSAGQSPPRKPGILIRAFKLTLDLFVSSTLALYASAIFTDKRRLLNDAAEIPLVEGRSMISDELCADFMRHYGSIPQSTWARYRDGRSDALGAIETFVVNCRRRDMYERRIRQERGLKPGGTAEHVLIPSSGVPRDLEVVLSEIGKDKASVNDDEGEADVFAVDSSSFGDDYYSDANEEGGVGNEDGSVGEWTSIDDFDKRSDAKSDSAESAKKGGWGW